MTGIAGAVPVAAWTRTLLAETGKVLLDREMDAPVLGEIREVAGPGHSAAVHDLHVWRVGRGAYSCAVTIVTSEPHLTADTVRRRLAEHKEIVHSTIEIHYADSAGKTCAGAVPDLSHTWR